MVQQVHHATSSNSLIAAANQSGSINHGHPNSSHNTDTQDGGILHHGNGSTDSPVLNAMFKRETPFNICLLSMTQSMNWLLNGKHKLGKAILGAVVIYVISLVFLYGGLHLDHRSSSSSSSSKPYHDPNGDIYQDKNYIITTTTASSLLEQQELLLANHKRKHGEDSDHGQSISVSTIAGNSDSHSESGMTDSTNEGLFQSLFTKHKQRKLNPLSYRPAMNYTVLTSAWERINSPWKHWSSVGFCNNGTSLLEDIPHDICYRRDCLFSPYHHIYIDLQKLREFQIDPTISSSNPLRFVNITWQGDLSFCRQPNGGQKPINFRQGQLPEVSFLYTLHNNADIATQSILEVFRTSHETDSSEFIIVHDHSNEDMSLVTNLLHNLRYFFHIAITEITPKTAANSPISGTIGTSKSSLGYLFANNLGMRKARGEYVVLLNSDVLVLPGWLKLLLRTMKTYRGGFDKVGMVGAMMLDSLGKVMEVGGNVYRNGQPFNTGRGYYPSELSQQHAREVDYISAACLLIRRDLFLSLNLFDPQYAPAYYEDTDAAFVHAQHGWKTIIQPFSVVLHFEGMSYGGGGDSGNAIDTPATINMKEQLMAANSQRFYESHKNLLIKHCPPINYSIPNGLIPQGKIPLRTDRQLDVHMGMTFYRQPNRILVLEDVVPEPDRDAGSIRLYELLLILTELGYSVTFEPQPITGRSIRYVLPLLAAGVNMVMPGTLKDMATASKTPFHDDIKRKLGAKALCPYDLLFIARRDVFERHLNDVRAVCSDVPIIFDTVDVHFIRELRMFTVKHKTTNAIQLMETVTTAQEELVKVLESQRRELSYMRMSNVTLVVSTEEKRILKNLLGTQADVRIISNIYRVPGNSAEDMIVSSSPSPLRNTSTGIDSSVLSASQVVSIVRNGGGTLRGSGSRVGAGNSDRENGNNSTRGSIRRILSTSTPSSLTPTTPTTSTATDMTTPTPAMRQLLKVSGGTTTETEERSGAIFVGNMCHTPNVDAVDFIVRNVLSDVNKLPSDFKMHFVWSRSLMCKNEILTNAEQHPLVVIHRDISNERLYALHKRVKVVLAPLRYGAGVKGKVNYALLHGVPVIATKVASEGMGLINEKNFLLAETGDEFINCINRIYNDNELFKILIKGGRQIMREMFGRDVAKERIRKTFNDLQVIAKNEHPQCPLVSEFDSMIGKGGPGMDWHSYWRSEELPMPNQPGNNQQAKYIFPLYPRIPYSDKRFLNYV